MKFGLIFLLVGIALSARASENPLDKAEDQITLAAVGDVMSHIKVMRSAKNFGTPDQFYYGHSFETLKNVFTNSDIAFANLETPIAKKTNLRKPFVFNAEPDLLRSLKWAGFNLVSVANNHSLDQGLKGLKDTLTLGEEEKIPMIGAGISQSLAEKGVCEAVKNIKICSVGFTRVGGESWRKVLKPGKTWLNVNNSDEEMVNIVKTLKAKSDLVIVSIHWGEEYRNRPLKWQRQLAEKLADAGANVILGHHPHVLQEIQILHGKDSKPDCLVAYSLGNFLSNQSQHYSINSKNALEGLPRDSIILKLKLSKDGFKTFEVTPLWTENSNTKGGHIEIKDLTALINVHLQKETELKADPLKNKKALGKNTQEIQFLKQRLSLIYKALKVSPTP